MASAINAIPGVFSSLSESTPSRYAIPAPKKYLDRCVEEIRTSEADAKKMDRFATAYKVATCAAVTFFVIATAAAVVLTGIYAPLYISLAMITVACGAQFILPVFKGLSNKSTTFAESAKKTRAVYLEYQAIQKKSVTDVHASLTDLAPRIALAQIERFKPLLAHYNYWKKIQEQNEVERLDQINEARKTDKKKVKKRIECYATAQFKQQEALIAKVYRAFIIAVMNKPDFKGKAEDVCSLNDFKLPLLSTTPYKEPRRANADPNSDKGPTLLFATEMHESPWLQRALYRQFGDSDAEEFIIFNKIGVESISLSQVENLTVSELANRILQVM